MSKATIGKRLDGLEAELNRTWPAVDPAIESRLSHNPDYLRLLAEFPERTGTTPYRYCRENRERAMEVPVEVADLLGDLLRVMTASGA